MAMMKMMKSAMKAQKMSSMKMKKTAKKAMKSMKKRAMKKTAKTYKSKQGAKNAVFSGKIMKTKGGKGKDTLMKNKRGRVVSKKQSAKGKASKWMKAVAAARKALGIKGFQIIGGKSAKGQQLLKKSRSLYK